MARRRKPWHCKAFGRLVSTWLVVILISVLVFGSQITGLQIIGYTISMVGFYVYQMAKMEQQKAMESMNIEMRNSSGKNGSER